MRDENNKKAFTLAEMMAVLMILGIIVAAALPVLTKRQMDSSTAVVSKSSIDGYWKKVTPSSDTSDIYFGTGDAQGVAIGQSSPGSNRLLLNTTLAGQNHIVFANDGTVVGKLKLAATNVALGLNALDSSATNSTAFGSLALNSNTGSDNTAIGSGALTSGSGSFNTAIGSDALNSSDTGANNTAVGSGALESNTTGSFNTAVGALALNSNTTGINNTAIGSLALPANNVGKNNTAIGYNTLAANTSGSDNTAVGYNACSSTVGSSNTCLGPGSNIEGSSNKSTAIGPGATATGSNATAIGFMARASANTIVLGGTQTTPIAVPYPKVLFPEKLVIGTLTGTLYINSNGVYVTSDRRLKNIDGKFVGGLEQVRKLQPYDFTFKKDDKKNQKVGVMAQDLQEVFPNAVTNGDNGYLMIRKEDMFYAMINSVKQLDEIAQNIVKQLKVVVTKVQSLDEGIIALIRVDEVKVKKISQLKEQNKSIKARLDKLERVR